MSKESKSITLPCRRYFEQRLIFFINCKYFVKRELTEDEHKVCDHSIMRAAVEFKSYDYALEMLEKDGYTVTIEDKVFKPDEIVPSTRDMMTDDITNVTDTLEPESDGSADEPIKTVYHSDSSEDLGEN